MTSDFQIRPISPNDRDFLKEMLYEAAWMEKSGEQFDQIDTTPALNQYVQDWGKFGDTGFLAYNKRSQQQYGAAWARLYEKPDCLAFIDGEIPELALATQPRARGMGVGRQLMEKLMEEISAQFKALSLNVRIENKTAIELYQSLGFTIIEGSAYSNRAKTTSVYMLATF